MPPDERFPPDDPRAWLSRARSNLVRSRNRADGVYLEDLCFDAQQAAEKALKALCIHRGVEFPYVHDLAELITRLQQAGASVPEGVRQAGRLTRYAVETRYPGLGEAVTEEEHERAITLAEKTVQWVEELLGTPPQEKTEEE